MTSEATTVDDPATAKATDSEMVPLVELFRVEGARLVRLARIFTDDRNAAEDLVQEAFIRLHRSYGRLRDPDRAAAYLRSIVLNLARDHNRRGLMSMRHQAAAYREPIPLEGAEGDVLARDERRAVVEALNSLSPRQRDCLVLRFYLDLTEKEIASTLGISQSSVKTHCQRGMAALETMLGEAR